MSSARRRKKAAAAEAISPRERRLRKRQRLVCAAEHWGPAPPALVADQFRRPFDTAGRVAYVKARCRRCRNQAIGVAFISDYEEFVMGSEHLPRLVEQRLLGAARACLSRVATHAKRTAWVASVRVAPWSGGWPRQ